MTDTRTQAHTAGPWVATSHPEGGERINSIRSKETKKAIALCQGGYGRPYVHHNQWEPNAARIVACVNAMDGLNPDAIADVVAALRDATDQLWLLAKEPESNPWVIQCKAALARLEAQS